MKAKFLFVAILFSQFATATQSQETINYCPQTLCGMANGSYYYYAQACSYPMCPNTYVCTDSSYDTGGSCGTCGGICNDGFSRSVKKDKAGKDPQDGFDTHYDIKDFSKFSDVDYWKKYGFRRVDPSTSVREFTLCATIGAKQHYFRCFEVDNSLSPLFVGKKKGEVEPMRIGWRLSVAPNGQPVPSTPTGNGHCHRLKTNETPARYFDVASHDALD
jgi:hypothetical protein